MCRNISQVLTSDTKSTEWWQIFAKSRKDVRSCHVHVDVLQLLEMIVFVKKSVTLITKFRYHRRLEYLLYQRNHDTHNIRFNSCYVWSTVVVKFRLKDEKVKLICLRAVFIFQVPTTTFLWICYSTIHEARFMGRSILCHEN